MPNQGGFVPTRVFVSFVYEDHAFKDQIVDWARRGLLGDVEVVTETDDMRQAGDGAVRGHLRRKLEDSDLALVLVGRNTHDRPWIDWEVAHRRSNEKPVIPVRIPNTMGAAPPEIRTVAEVRFDPQSVRQAIQDAARRRR